MAPLPPELWDIIIGDLKADMDFVTGRNVPIIQSCLRSLCLTSRQLHSNASQHLYAVPITKRPFLLVRTLADRPALALLVKSLDCWLWKPSAWPPRDHFSYLSPYFAGIVRDYIIRQLQHECSERTRLHGRHMVWGLDFGVEDRNMPWNKEICDAITIGLLPNLTDVLFQNGLKPILPGMPLGSLPHLVSAKVVFYWSTTSIRRLPPGQLYRLALIAPNLRSLALADKFSCSKYILNEKFWLRSVGNGVGVSSSLSPATAPLFPYVTQLCLSGFFLAKSQLPVMLHAFPALESLHMSVVASRRPGYHCNTQALQAALLEHAPGLRRLLVRAVFTLVVPAEYAVSNMQYFHYETMRPMTWSSELAGLKKLQVLDTSLSLIRRGLDRALPPLSPLSAEWLVRIMPPSLEVLAVRGYDANCARHTETLVPALRGLAEAVELRAFPMFKRLIFPDGIVPHHALLISFKALEKQGVEVVWKAKFQSCRAPGKSLGCMGSYDRFLRV